jgi:hypothetical protein
MPIHVRDPMEHDPQWRVRKKKDLPPEILRIASVLDFELRDHLKKGAPAGLTLQAAIAVVREMQVISSDKGKVSVAKRHDAPGGSHDMANEMRKAWASGKYKSREKCADEMHQKLGIERKAARNALIRTPNPAR